MNASQRQQVRQFFLAPLGGGGEGGGFNFFFVGGVDLGGGGPLISFPLVGWGGAGGAGKGGCAISDAAHLIYPIEANPLWSQEWVGWGHPLGHKDGWSSDNRAFFEY